MVDGVNNQVTTLNLNLLRQGGDVALEEIRNKLYSNIEDPSVAQTMAKKTLEVLVLSGLVNLDLPKGDFNDRQKVEGLDKSLQGASENLTLDMHAVMSLILKVAISVRAGARERRQAELTSEAKAMGDSANKIREAAEKRFAAAVVQAVGQILSGVASMAGSFAGLKAGEKLASSVSQIGSSIGSIVDGAFKIGGAHLEKEAAELDALKADLDKLAMLFEKARESESDMMNSMKEVIGDILQKLDAILRSQVETNKGIARNI